MIRTGGLRTGALVCTAGLLWTAGLWSAPNGVLAPAVAAGCSGGSGVTVVVDYGGYGGTETGCAPDPGNGLAALAQAGFAVAQVSSQPGFVCRIDGIPPVEDDACVRTPPATAYWSYWRAVPGGGWTYQSSGAGGSSPRDGDTEGWSFGPGSPPGLAPPPNTPAPPTVAPPPPPPAPRTSPPGTSSPRQAPSTSAAAPTGAPTRPRTTRAPLPPVATAAPAPSGPAGVTPGRSGATRGAPAEGPTPDSGPVPSGPGPTDPGPSGPGSSGPGSSGPGPSGSATLAGDAAGPGGSGPDSAGLPWSVPALVAVIAALGAGSWWQARRRG